jgi:hypothetical protein
MDRFGYIDAYEYLATSYITNLFQLATPVASETASIEGFSHLMPSQYVDESNQFDDISVESFQFNDFAFGSLDWGLGQTWS